MKMWIGAWVCFRLPDNRGRKIVYSERMDGYLTKCCRVKDSSKYNE